MLELEQEVGQVATVLPSPPSGTTMLSKDLIVVN